MQFVALYDYATAEPDELPFSEGDLVMVTDSSNADWWRGTCNGKVRRTSLVVCLANLRPLVCVLPVSLLALISREQAGLFPANYVEVAA